MPHHRRLSSGELWRVFHTANPHVYALLVAYCREWARAGHVAFGIRAPWERLRWDLGLRTDSADFKLNDHLTSFYARLIVRQEPDLAALLSLRSAPEADEVVANYLAECDVDEHGQFAMFPEQRDGRDR